jgi:hypothetical protein
MTYQIKSKIILLFTSKTPISDHITHIPQIMIFRSNLAIVRQFWQNLVVIARFVSACLVKTEIKQSKIS